MNFGEVGQAAVMRPCAESRLLIWSRITAVWPKKASRCLLLLGIQPLSLTHMGRDSNNAGKGQHRMLGESRDIWGWSKGLEVEVVTFKVCMHVSLWPLRPVCRSKWWDISNRLTLAVELLTNTLTVCGNNCKLLSDLPWQTFTTPGPADIAAIYLKKYFLC